MLVAAIVRLMILLLLITILVWGGIDIYVGQVYGKENMFSPVLHQIAREQPIIPCLIGLGVGLVLGHLFWAR